MRLWGTLLGLLTWALAVAQAPPSAVAPVVVGAPLTARADGPWTLVAADDLARALGATTSAEDGAFTLRLPSGVLTVFADQPDALWQAAGAVEPTSTWSALPVPVRDGRWFLPEDLLDVLHVAVDGDAVQLPDGTWRPLAFERAPVAAAAAGQVVALGPAVEGLRLYAEGVAGQAAVSLLAVDLGLVGLAFPEQQAALDAVLRDLGDAKALLLVVTAVADAAWQPAVFVIQDGRETLLSAPFAVQVLDGDPERVTPAAPVVAVAFLPPDLDVRRPLTLRWAGASGTWTLRR